MAAQFFTANMNDPAKEGTVAQYDGTIEQLKELHQTMFPLFKLQQNLFGRFRKGPDTVIIRKRQRQNSYQQRQIRYGDRPRSRRGWRQ